MNVRPRAVSVLIFLATAIAPALRSEAQPRRAAPTPSASAKPSATPSSSASVIPIPGNTVHVSGGTFVIGITGGSRSDLKAHSVTLAPFDIDVTEVTVAAYRACVAAGACTPADADKDGAQDVCTWFKRRPDLPINCVSTAQAETFCSWTGKRLPTEAEWEFAARGTDGRQYPWGNDAPVSQPCWSGDPKFGNSNSGQGVACVVGSHPDDRSPFGVLDMAGNLSEWTSSGPCDFDTQPCGNNDVYRVRRGGDHFASTPDPLHATYRTPEVGAWGYEQTGFRCARGSAPTDGGSGR